MNKVLSPDQEIISAQFRAAKRCLIESIENANHKFAFELLSTFKSLAVVSLDYDPRRSTLDKTALHYCAQFNNCEVAEYLLNGRSQTEKSKLPLDIEAKEQFSDFTPLLVAVLHGNLEITEMLLEAGANWELKTKFGKKVKEVARDARNFKVMRVLHKWELKKEQERSKEEETEEIKKEKQRKMSEKIRRIGFYHNCD